MSTNSTITKNPKKLPGYIVFFLWAVGLSGLSLLGYAVNYLFTHTVIGGQATSALNWLFAMDSTQLWWYVTRSSGIIAYLLLWISMLWGLAVSSKVFDPLLQRNHTYDFHEFISLLALGFTLVHMAVLLLDRYMPFSLSQLLIGFNAPYRAFWIGIGAIGFYLSVIVTITFYLRKRIGPRMFRIIHYFSFLGYIGVTFHGLYAGTDSALLSMKLVYYFTSMSVVFFTVYWIFSLIQKRAQSRNAASRIAEPQQGVLITAKHLPAHK